MGFLPDREERLLKLYGTYENFPVSKTDMIDNAQRAGTKQASTRGQEPQKSATFEAGMVFSILPSSTALARREWSPAGFAGPSRASSSVPFPDLLHLARGTCGRAVALAVAS